MLRRVLANALVVLFLVVIGLSTAFYIAFNTPTVSKKIIRHVLARQFPQYRIAKLNIRRQHFFFPEKLVLSDVVLKLIVNKQSFEFAADQIFLDDLCRVFKKQSPLQIAVKGARINSEGITLESIQSESFIELKSDLDYRFKGIATVKSAEFFSEKLSGIRMDFLGDQNQVQIKNGLAKCYGGTLKAELILQMHPAIKYSVNLLLNYLDFNELRKINEAYAGLEGKLSGQISVSGEGRKVEAISLNLDVSQGGKINSVLFKSLVQSVPMINLDKEKMKLFDSPSMIPFEKETIQLKNLNDKELSGLIVLESRKLNMNFNLEPTIRIDGSLTGLLEQWHKFSSAVP